LISLCNHCHAAAATIAATSATWAEIAGTTATQQHLQQWLTVHRILRLMDE